MLHAASALRVASWAASATARTLAPSLTRAHRYPSHALVQRWCCSGCRTMSSSVVASNTPSAPSPPRVRHACPECCRSFLCEANLVRHRTARHGVRVTSASDVAQAQLVAHNAQLRQELARVTARVRHLRTNVSAASPAGGASTPEPAATDAATDVAAAATASVAAQEDETAFYPSAVPTGRLMEVDAAVEQQWRRSGRGLGTGISVVDCVGTVRGRVELGVLRGTCTTVVDGVAAETTPRVLQFCVEVHGYRERRPGQVMLHRAHLLVRHTIAESSRRPGLYSVREGDVVHVHGHYALHSTYDMISKLSIENVVVEADAVGLLRAAPPPPPPPTGSATPTTAERETAP
ncbi:hypothetical protein NESM_000906700 [Novymonas esmeraldas]|uniref:C2H2-type domain-containing protein n=1 Tax=Novymonas esmeraldas TaxID=1808958 RepID=A0AAW0F153_9TRYP